MESMTRHTTVLVVEDDATNAQLLKRALLLDGHRVSLAEDADTAQKIILESSTAPFHCVVTDLHMPGRSGLELLSWIKAHDPALATIIVTAEGERESVTASLRGGATDFLDKPVEFAKLRAAVEHAVCQTCRQRTLAQSESALRDLGRAQEWMLGLEAGRGKARANICFHPRHEAGGDYFTQFQLGPCQEFFLLTDVSGHDAQAAYISAYFHGIVRGMLEQKASVTEIFQTFNRLLLDEWNSSQGPNRHTAFVEASVAACAILLDGNAQSATVVSHGTPAPVFWQPDGRASTIGERGGAPLGWFPQLTPGCRVQPTFGDGSFCLWTDGMEDLARSKGVTELSLALALQRAKKENEKVDGIESAGDDILLADIHLPSSNPSPQGFRPLILECYTGNQLEEIDELQGVWERSLDLAVPGIGDASRHDILLASREAVLNAMRHGCGRRGNCTASFQAALNESTRTVRVQVSDPGPGHHFRVEDSNPIEGGNNLAAEHRGLVLIKHCATKLSLGRNGAAVTMDFDLS